MGHGVKDEKGGRRSEVSIKTEGRRQKAEDRRQRSDDRGQTTEDRRQKAAVLSFHRASRHVATPSSGHYAALSFVVIGGDRGWILDCGLRV